MLAQERYMDRCLTLARLGAGYVAPNPMVGAVLVHQDRIIGEGYHQKYGEAHAEVNCIASVKPEDQHLVQHSTIYVSLEPCAHHGKTPPCADLIIRSGIKNVVVGCQDPFTEVDGKGIEKLLEAGVEVITGVLEVACRELNRAFFSMHRLHRPLIILKWAQTRNGMIGWKGTDRMKISNPLTDRLVHKWRSEVSSILVGTNTAALDDPSLTNRTWSGNSPLRLVLDMELRLPEHLRLFDNAQPTIVFNRKKHETHDAVRLYKLPLAENMPAQIAMAINDLGINSVLVEGGSMLLQAFIDAGLWDEIRIITNTAMLTDDGIPAPSVGRAIIRDRINLGNDEILFMQPVTKQKMMPDG